MKVVLLGDAGSVHTIKWANGLAEAGLDVYLVSLHELKNKLNKNVTFYRLPYGAPIGYFLSKRRLSKIVNKIQPDIINAHYATGYGFLARTVAKYPYVLSVWGSDVYDFPNKTLLHKFVLYGNLRCATAIASTSKAMARETKKIYQHPNIYVTPFGVDENIFCPPKENFDHDEVIIGTVKTLSYIYGIDILIKAFSYAYENLGKPENLKLEITGDGPEMYNLKSLARHLKIEHKVKFTGAVEHSKVPEILRRFDIYVALSREESFGVAILEACACAKPVIVSDTDGLSEIVRNNVTGYIIRRENIEGAANKMIELVLNADKRKMMGLSARKHVLQNFSTNKCVGYMLELYNNLLT